jgi:YD repeat-containing protein
MGGSRLKGFDTRRRDRARQLCCANRLCRDVRTGYASRATLAAWALAMVLGAAAGRSALAADQTIYTYDALGRLQSVQYQNGTTVAYTYDPAGNRTQVANTGGSGSTGGPQLPQQRRKLAALQAVLSILLDK